MNFFNSIKSSISARLSKDNQQENPPVDCLDSEPTDYEPDFVVPQHEFLTPSVPQTERERLLREEWEVIKKYCNTESFYLDRPNDSE